MEWQGQGIKGGPSKASDLGGQYEVPIWQTDADQVWRGREGQHREGSMNLGEICCIYVSMYICMYVCVSVSCIY